MSGILPLITQRASNQSEVTLVKCLEADKSIIRFLQPQVFETIHKSATLVYEKY